MPKPAPLFAPLSLALLLASAAAAQAPQPWEYYPLGVGDVWEYAEPATGNTLRLHIARDTVVNGRDYVVHVRDFFDADGTPIPPVSVNRSAVRYDTASTHVYRVIPVDSTREQVYLWAPCPFGARLGDVVDCGAFGGTGTVSEFAGPLTIGDTVLTGVWFKQYETVAALVTYAAGFGEAELWSKFDPYRYLIYARVSGVEYGRPRFPVAAEPGPASSGALVLSAYPNPARDRATVAFTLASPTPVRLAVYDGLGRAVLTWDLGTFPAGRHETALDLAGLAPGLYAVRVTAGAASGAFRVVLRGRASA